MYYKSKMFCRSGHPSCTFRTLNSLLWVVSVRYTAIGHVPCSRRASDRLQCILLLCDTKTITSIYCPTNV